MLITGTDLGLYDAFRNEAKIKEVIVRVRVSATGILDTCRVGYCEEGAIGNTQSTTFTPADTLWNEYTHLSGGADGYGNDLNWFVEFPQILSGTPFVPNVDASFTIDVQYVRVIQRLF